MSDAENAHLPCKHIIGSKKGEDKRHAVAEPVKAAVKEMQQRHSLVKPASKKTKPCRGYDLAVVSPKEYASHILSCVCLALLRRPTKNSGVVDGPAEDSTLRSYP